MTVNRYERVIQEDLNLGTDMTWIHAPGRGELRSTQVGIHTFARGQLQYTTAWTPGAVAASSYATTTISVPNATVGDPVLASHDKILTNDLLIHGHVSASGTVTAVIYNPTAAAITVAAGTLAVLVFPMVDAVSVPVTLYSATAQLYIDGNNLSTYPATVTFKVDLLDAGLVETDTTTVAGGETGAVTFSNIAGGTYSIKATVTGAGGYSFDATVVTAGPLEVDEDPEDFGPIEFTTGGE